MTDPIKENKKDITSMTDPNRIETQNFASPPTPRSITNMADPTKENNQDITSMTDPNQVKTQYFASQSQRMNTPTSKESKAVPKVRFPEFEISLANLRLGDIVSFKSGGTPSKKNPSLWGGDVTWIRASSMVEKV